MFGNRGGKFHDPATRQLLRRHWASRVWICCVLDYTPKNRKPLRTTEVMSAARYTELFFLDEATALAAGHRPCFQCRYRDAVRFREAFVQGHPELELPPDVAASEMDRILHAARLDGAGKRTFGAVTANVPDGAFVSFPGEEGVAWLRWRGTFHRWSFGGYDSEARGDVPSAAVVLTPAPMVHVLRAGYVPGVHPSLG